MSINSAPGLAGLLLFLFKTLSVSAVDKSICSLSCFGLPDYDAYNLLLFSGTMGKLRVINVTDGADHAFLPSDFAKSSELTEEW